MKTYNEILSEATIHNGKIFISFDRDISKELCGFSIDDTGLFGQQITDEEAIQVERVMMENGHGGAILINQFGDTDYKTMAFDSI